MRRSVSRFRRSPRLHSRRTRAAVRRTPRGAPAFSSPANSLLTASSLRLQAPPDGSVEYQWFPHCVIRKPDRARTAVHHSHVSAQQAARRDAVHHGKESWAISAHASPLAFDMRGATAKKTTPWFVNSPGEADNKITFDAQRGCLLFEAQHSQSAAAQGFLLGQTALEQKRMLAFEMKLGAGEQKQLNFTVALAENGGRALELYDKLQANFAAIEKQSEADFSSLVEAAFTPGNSEFSGNLPRLVTENESLWKLYHNGFANLLFARRVSPDSVYGPTYLTLSGHVLPTLSFPWDTSLASLALALLDPCRCANLSKSGRSSTCTITIPPITFPGRAVGPWYAVNDTAIVRCAWRYVCVTGDFAWLDKKVGDRTILEHLEYHALYWKKLDHSGEDLATTAPSRTCSKWSAPILHEVAGMNANNVHACAWLPTCTRMRGECCACAAIAR